MKFVIVGMIMLVAWYLITTLFVAGNEVVMIIMAIGIDVVND
jgi:hypothetical protein